VLCNGSEILLLHGADWNKPDADGKTPWDIAKEIGQKEMIAVISRFKDAREVGYFSRRNAESNSITPPFKIIPWTKGC
jgi:hypothetical protein